MKKLLYTVILGTGDHLKEPLRELPEWKLICFTDQNIKSDRWEVIKVDGKNPRKTSRYYKTHPPEGYDLTCYIDATFTVRGNLDRLIRGKTEGIWMAKHPMRQCAYEEIEVVRRNKLDDESILNSRIAKYRSEGFPENFGLWRGGIILQNPRDPLNQKFNEAWWQEIEEGTWRDQCSVSYASWKTGTKINSFLSHQPDVYFQQSLHCVHPGCEWFFWGEGTWDKNLANNPNPPHLYILNNGLLFPSWLKNYIPRKYGKETFIDLVNQLNGKIVYI